MSTDVLRPPGISRDRTWAAGELARTRSMRSPTMLTRQISRQMTVRKGKIVARISVSASICTMAPITELLASTVSFLEVKLAALEKVIAFSNVALEPGACVLKFSGQGVASAETTLFAEDMLLEELPGVSYSNGILEKLFFVLERSSGEKIQPKITSVAATASIFATTASPSSQKPINDELWGGIFETETAVSKMPTTFEELEAAQSASLVVTLSPSEKRIPPGAPSLLTQPSVSSTVKFSRLLSRGIEESESFTVTDLEAVAMSFQAQIDDLRQQLVQERQTKQKTSTISSLLSRGNSSSSSVDAKAFERVSTELSQARSELAQLRAVVEQERKRFASSSKSQSEATEQIQVLKQSEAKLKAENDKIKQETQLASEQILSLQKKVKEQNALLISKEEEAQTLMPSKGTEGKREQQQKYSSLQQQLRDQQDFASNLKRELEIAQSKLKESEQQVVSTRAENQSAALQAIRVSEETNIRIESLKQQLQQAQTRGDQQSKTLQEAEAVIADLKQVYERDMLLFNTERDRAQSTLRHLQDSAAEEALLKEEMRMLEEEHKQEILLRQQEMESANRELEQARAAMKEQYKLELETMIAAKDHERAAAIHMMTLTKTPRTRIVDEIISTELTYVSSLQACVDLYLTPLKMDAKMYGLTQADVELLFRNLADVAGIHKKMYEDLVDRFKAWTNYEMSQLLGDIFLEYIPVFRIYSDYVDRHPQALILLDGLRGGPLDKLIKANTENPRSHGQNLTSCLIMPIQRIPRYKLLLQELIKMSDSRHPDYDSLCLAVKLVKEVATHINESLRQNENGMVLSRLRGELEPGPSASRQDLFDLLELPRYLVYQGFLAKVGRRGTKRYMFFLFNDALLYGSRSLTKKYTVRLIMPFDQWFKIEEVKETSRATIGRPTGTLSRSPPPPAPRVSNMQDLPPNSPKLLTSVSESKPPPAPPKLLSGSSEIKQAAEEGVRLRITSGAKSFVVLVESENDVWLSHLRPLCQVVEPKPGLGRSTPMPTTIEEYVSCQLCDKKFGIVRRRHHCRGCGLAVCHQCSLTRSVLTPNGESERVCDKCKISRT